MVFVRAQLIPADARTNAYANCLLLGVPGVTLQRPVVRLRSREREWRVHMRICLHTCTHVHMTMRQAW